ncbi:hypothetical protein CDCA_CDCA12G3542 [Cyanidium caldarium]|uniref:C2H2-type domain-containing protein n=1 Tax=Cyanidium caldarium TaxID=2771 RepID=A0AAV9IYZ6_CYACA|nr:hypothetical protein CDCA_CDCA12G3542 [Cyanidium caldarium]
MSRSALRRASSSTDLYLAVARTSRDAAHPRRWRLAQYPCPQCPKSFTSKQHRTTHVRAIHEKRRDYGCGTCGQRFARKSAQVTHVRCVHEGRRDHQCGYCGQRFGRKNGLNKHVAAVHGKSRDYVCLCGAAFARKDVLLRHKRGVHEAERDKERGAEGRGMVAGPFAGAVSGPETSLSGAADTTTDATDTFALSSRSSTPRPSSPLPQR